MATTVTYYVLVDKSYLETVIMQYSQRHTMINHCDRRITDLSDTDIFFVLFNISSKFLLYLECYLLLPKMHKKVSK
jgi:7-cyano-7-deazaguanine synthase in queuosine biosynthesis